MKILCLGNEFVKEDSLAKKISKELAQEDFNIIFIKDSFELMEKINSGTDFIILDVVKGLKDVQIISVDDLKNSKIITSHDFDASFILKLVGKDKKIKIIGIPMSSDIDNVKNSVKKLALQNIY